MDHSAVLAIAGTQQHPIPGQRKRSSSGSVLADTATAVHPLVPVQYIQEP